jgi:predicted transcriptional regulator
MEINEMTESKVLRENKVLKVDLLNNFSDIEEIETDEEIELIVKALSSKTRRNILQEIQSEPMDVSNLAARLKMTEANISAQVKKLQEAGLIDCDYSAGKHGVRKLSKIKFNQLLLRF